ncbi:MAG: hypothetical protein RLZZ221_1338, partial [Verrucomicrobiota bacterium]
MAPELGPGDARRGLGFDDPQLVEAFFRTLQSRFLEVFHPYLITTRA